MSEVKSKKSHSHKSQSSKAEPADSEGTRIELSEVKKSHAEVDANDEEAQLTPAESKKLKKKHTKKLKKKANENNDAIAPSGGGGGGGNGDDDDDDGKDLIDNTAPATVVEPSAPSAPPAPQEIRHVDPKEQIANVTKSIGDRQDAFDRIKERNKELEPVERKSGPLLYDPPKLQSMDVDENQDPGNTNTQYYETSRCICCCFNCC